MPDLKAKDLEFNYPGGFALRGIDLNIPGQSFLALVGPNGSGKTTLLHLLSGLLLPQSGGVYLDEQPVGAFGARELAKRLAVISSEQYFEFPFPVVEVVSMGRYAHLGRLEGLSAEDRRIVEGSMEMTQTLQLRTRPISQLSSGERQRVLIARALAQQPSILMLDEPNAHLDISHQIAIFRLLRRLNRENGMTVVVVLHDLTAAAAFCRTVVLLHEGRLVKTGTPAEVLTTETIQRVYQANVEVHPSPLGGFPQVTYPVE